MDHPAQGKQIFQYRLLRYNHMLSMWNHLWHKAYSLPLASECQFLLDNFQIQGWHAQGTSHDPVDIYLPYSCIRQYQDHLWMLRSILPSWYHFYQCPHSVWKQCLQRLLPLFFSCFPVTTLHQVRSSRNRLHWRLVCWDQVYVQLLQCVWQVYNHYSVCHVPKFHFR